jgi:glutamyl-tRNA synthetase
LTGRESGPDMASLVAAIGKERAIERLKAAAKR